MLIQDDLSSEKIQRFGKVFIGGYLTSGFGVLPKGQIDLLIFYSLQEAGVFRGKNNYEIATLLGITEARVRNLRLNASLRFTEVNRTEKMREILSHLFEYGEARAISREGVVSFELDDPVLQREFEQAARDIGYFTDTSFNKSVIRVEVHVFLAVVASVYEDAAKQVARVLNNEAKNIKGAKGELVKHEGFAAKALYLMDKHEDKIQLAGRLVAALKPLVGAPPG